MAKLVNTAVLDAALNEIKNTATLMIVCSTQPTTRAEAVTTYALADVAVTAADFTLANGDTSGRKVAVAAKNSVIIDASGTPPVEPPAQRRIYYDYTDHQIRLRVSKYVILDL